MGDKDGFLFLGVKILLVLSKTFLIYKFWTISMKWQAASLIPNHMGEISPSTKLKITHAHKAYEILLLSYCLIFDYKINKDNK